METLGVGKSLEEVMPELGSEAEQEEGETISGREEGCSLLEGTVWWV